MIKTKTIKITIGFLHPPWAWTPDNKKQNKNNKIPTSLVLGTTYTAQATCSCVLHGLGPLIQ